MTQHVDVDQATRYAEVSNDWSAHHFDLDAARRIRVRLPVRPRTVHDGDVHPGRRRAWWPTVIRRACSRVAVRFASPTRLDEDLTVDVFEIDARTYAFEATCAGATVIKHGRLELFDARLLSDR